MNIRENITPKGDGNLSNMSAAFCAWVMYIRENITPKGDGNNAKSSNVPL